MDNHSTALYLSIIQPCYTSIHQDLNSIFQVSWTLLYCFWLWLARFLFLLTVTTRDIVDWMS